ncbi:substrate-binding domain-containing protein (plasmid) [Deinococcus sp. KNUC1210]|uniref:LacI family DNA-binding transcriptional regulator n=1 Tax=Deinococcus sp. KNUC1210 TaxID=2917691 RepID=UPI001EEF8886|nr:substrate-binding domain-containing protein [Deinococcus sp. KNUC1210]ULH17183.1 substrate-binding domain-containing protein [Deinococcus sp. KNUC1210]
MPNLNSAATGTIPSATDTDTASASHDSASGKDASVAKEPVRAKVGLRPKATTILDVAARASVSHQTVSRVLNDHPAVAPATRSRVLAAMHDLDYRPNAAARHLAGRRGHTVGVLVYGVSYFGPTQMLASVEQAARARGYSVTVIFVHDLSVQGIEEGVRALRAGRVDGIIMITPLHQVEASRHHEILDDVPYVLVDAEPMPDRAVVAIDQFAGGRAAALHIALLGHRRIAVLRGPDEWYDATSRYQGTLSLLAQRRLLPVLTLSGDWTAASGYQVTCDALAQGAAFTALIAANDQMAVGAMRAIQETGKVVPADVSVIGFDDLPESAYFNPPLTTVRQDFRALGAASLERLIDLIETPQQNPPSSVLVPTLTIRGSTAAPPVDKI